MWFLWLPIKELLGICGRLNFLSVGQNNKKKILPRTSSEFLPLTWDVLPSHSPHPSAHHLALWACSRIPLPLSLPFISLFSLPLSLSFYLFLSHSLAVFACQPPVNILPAEAESEAGLSHSFTAVGLLHSTPVADPPPPSLPRLTFFKSISKLIEVVSWFGDDNFVPCFFRMSLA